MNALDRLTDMPALARATRGSVPALVCAQPGGAPKNAALRCHQPDPVPDDDEDDDEDDDRGSSGGNIDPDEDEGDFDDEDEDDDETLWTRRHRPGC